MPGFSAHIRGGKQLGESMLHARALRYLDEVARRGSIRAAAGRLNVSSSAINRQILELENDLGAQIFQRLPKRLRLTPIGELLIAHVRQTLKDYERIQLRIEDLKGARSGEVTIATMNGLAGGLLPSVLAAFQRTHPRVQVSVRSLFAEDIVKAVLMDGREVMCTSSELTRDHMEVRGIGIINVAQMFGVKAIRKDKSLDLIVTLKTWNEVADVDRLGMEQEFVKVLGIDIPHVTIPVRPGRDIARLIEVAAFQTKLRKSGYNAAEDLNNRLLAQMAATQPVPPSSP